MPPRPTGTASRPGLSASKGPAAPPARAATPPAKSSSKPAPASPLAASAPIFGAPAPAAPTAPVVAAGPVADSPVETASAIASPPASELSSGRESVPGSVSPTELSATSAVPTFQSGSDLAELAPIDPTRGKRQQRLALMIGGGLLAVVALGWDSRAGVREAARLQPTQRLPSLPRPLLPGTGSSSFSFRGHPEVGQSRGQS